MIRKTSILIEDSLYNFVQYGLTILEQYDEDLKSQRLQRKQLESKPEETKENPSRWEPVKEEIKDMSIRHFSNLRDTVITTWTYIYVDSQLNLSARIERLYTFLLESYKYLNENDWFSIKNVGTLIYDVGSKNILIICEQAQQSAIYRFLTTQFQHVQVIFGNGWIRLRGSFEKADSAKMIQDIASRIVTEINELPERTRGIKRLYKWALDYMRWEISESEGSIETQDSIELSSSKMQDSDSADLIRRPKNAWRGRIERVWKSLEQSLNDSKDSSKGSDNKYLSPLSWE